MTGGENDPVLLITFIITKIREAKGRKDITYRNLSYKMNDVKPEWRRMLGPANMITPAHDECTPGSDPRRRKNEMPNDWCNDLHDTHRGARGVQPEGRRKYQPRVDIRAALTT